MDAVDFGPEEDGVIRTAQSTDLAVVQQSRMLVPVISGEDMKESIAQWQRLKNTVLDPDDWQSAGAKKFIKKSGWEKLSMVFGVSVEVLSFKSIPDVGGEIVAAEVHARATAPNGRFEDGVGACNVRETRFRSEQARQKLHHDLLATAESRARNRACSNLFGHGEVSYEEAALGGREIVYDVPQQRERVESHGDQMRRQAWNELQQLGAARIPDALKAVGMGKEEYGTRLFSATDEALEALLVVIRELAAA